MKNFRQDPRYKFLMRETKELSDGKYITIKDGSFKITVRILWESECEAGIDFSSLELSTISKSKIIKMLCNELSCGIASDATDCLIEEISKSKEYKKFNKRIKKVCKVIEQLESDSIYGDGEPFSFEEDILAVLGV